MALPFHPQPKPEPRKRAKARKTRREALVKRAVRAACMKREEGRCRITGPGCDGPLEWAHLAGWRRSQTRGMAPEIRHDSRFSLMLCRKHHRMEEAGQLTVTFFTTQGCDGPLAFS